MPFQRSQLDSQEFDGLLQLAMDSHGENTEIHSVRFQTLRVTPTIPREPPVFVPSHLPSNAELLLRFGVVAMLLVGSLRLVQLSIGSETSLLFRSIQVGFLLACNLAATSWLSSRTTLILIAGIPYLFVWELLSRATERILDLDPFLIRSVYILQCFLFLWMSRNRVLVEESRSRSSMSLAFVGFFVACVAVLLAGRQTFDFSYISVLDASVKGIPFACMCLGAAACYLTAMSRQEDSRAESYGWMFLPGGCGLITILWQLVAASPSMNVLVVFLVSIATVYAIGCGSRAIESTQSTI